jgi:O-antigen/teichoic acid export membrane protein
VGSAITPIYMRLYDDKGREATEAFLSRSLRYFLLAGFPLVAGMTAVGADALVLLASEKYRHGAVIVGWVISGIFVGALQSITVAGLYVSSRTRIIMLMVVASAALNIALNLVLIPRLGIEGAGIATLVAYAALTLGLQVLSWAKIRVHFPWLAALLFSAASVVMFLVVRAVNVGPPLIRLLVKVALGAAVYAVVVVSADHETRAMVLPVLRRLRRLRRR